jgi:hypothetical protein
MFDSTIPGHTPLRAGSEVPVGFVGILEIVRNGIGHTVAAAILEGGDLRYSKERAYAIAPEAGADRRIATRIERAQKSALGSAITIRLAGARANSRIHAASSALAGGPG